MVKYRVKKDTVLWKTNELYNDKADALALTIPQAIAYGIIEEVKEEVTLEQMILERYGVNFTVVTPAVREWVGKKIDGLEILGKAGKDEYISKSELKKALGIE